MLFWLKFFFSSGIGAKLRPALVLSDDIYNKNRDEIIVLGITSNMKRLHEGDTAITEWEKAGLKLPSLASAVIQTVKKNRVQKRLGLLEKNTFEKIEKNISRVLGFAIRQ